MSRKLTRGSRLVVASHNAGKVWEIGQLIAPYGLDAVSAADLALPEPDETEATFHGNAQLKAVAAAKASGLVALADDSGLEVECLGGAPGIYSARWAGPDKDFGVAMRKVGEEVTARHGWAAPGPSANFISVLCLAWPDGTSEFFEGKVFGHLVWPPRGGNGFGYDPMFVADGETQTFGEMQPEQKYAISHRTRAFAAFKEQCLAGVTEARAVVAAPAETSMRDAAALTAAASSLSTRLELAEFIQRLRKDLKTHPDAWANLTLDDYLEAMQAYLRDSDDHNDPKWRAMAHALLAASVYE